MGYTEDDVAKMIWAIETAYEIIDGAPQVDKHLLQARDFLQGLYVEGRI